MLLLLGGGLPAVLLRGSDAIVMRDASVYLLSSVVALKDLPASQLLAGLQSDLPPLCLFLLP